MAEATLDVVVERKFFCTKVYDMLTVNLFRKKKQYIKFRGNIPGKCATWNSGIVTEGYY